MSQAEGASTNFVSLLTRRAPGSYLESCKAALYCPCQHAAARHLFADPIVLIPLPPCMSVRRGCFLDHCAFAAYVPPLRCMRTTAAMVESTVQRHDSDSESGSDARKQAPEGHKLRKSKTALQFASSKLNLVNNPVQSVNANAEEERLIPDPHGKLQTPDPSAEQSPLRFAKVFTYPGLKGRRGSLMRRHDVARIGIDVGAVLRPVVRREFERFCDRPPRHRTENSDPIHRILPVGRSSHCICCSL